MALVQKLQGLRSLLCDCFVTMFFAWSTVWVRASWVLSLKPGILRKCVAACCIASVKGVCWQFVQYYSEAGSVLNEALQTGTRKCLCLVSTALPMSYKRTAPKRFLGSSFKREALALACETMQCLPVWNAAISVFSEVVKVYKKLFGLAGIE